MKKIDYYVLMATLLSGGIFFHYIGLEMYSTSFLTLFIYMVKDLFNLEKTDSADKEVQEFLKNK